MTIHPLFVHFPIALFTLYVLAELVRLKRLREEASWLYIKAALVIVGALSAAATLLAGEHDEGLLGHDSSIRTIVELHSTLAYTTTILFTALALVYLVAVIAKSNIITHAFIARISPYAFWYANSWLAPLVALIGLALITITGALGGSLVYGRDADPMITLVYKLFGLQ